MDTIVEDILNQARSLPAMRALIKESFEQDGHTVSIVNFKDMVGHAPLVMCDDNFLRVYALVTTEGLVHRGIPPLKVTHEAGIWSDWTVVFNNGAIKSYLFMFEACLFN